MVVFHVSTFILQLHVAGGCVFMDSMLPVRLRPAAADIPIYNHPCADRRQTAPQWHPGA